MSELDLKDWLEYKLATVKNVNISSASGWIAEYIELEQLQTNVIEELGKFNEWKNNTLIDCEDDLIKQ